MLFICPVCTSKGKDHKYMYAEHGEVTLRFENGHVWTFPTLILHYIHDHKWLPPEEFITDVLQGSLCFYPQAEQESVFKKIGYLKESDLEEHNIPEKLIEQLELLIEEVNKHNNDVKYRGAGDK